MAYVNYGAEYGKAVVIVDIANQSRVLVDGENFPRAMMPVRRLNLTKFKVEIPRAARHGLVVKKAQEYGLAAKWEASPVAKKLAKQATRSNLSDLERFSVMVNRKRRSCEAKQLAAKVLGKKKRISKKK